MDNVDLDLSLFDYALPDDQIAQEPLADRAASRMLVLYRKEQRWEDRQFRDFPSFLQPGDCLVFSSGGKLTFKKPKMDYLNQFFRMDDAMAPAL